MKRKCLFVLLTLFYTTAFAQDLPRIAVYVTGDAAENDRKALGTRMMSALVNSGRYRGIERSDAFLAKVDEEHVRQRSGAIDDEQISALGRQFGVEFICIADITPSLGEYQVSARVINIETAEVAFIGDAASPLKTLKDLSDVSDKVVRTMFGLPEPDTRKSPFSIGAGGFFAGDFGGGIVWRDAGEQVVMPNIGGGAYLFIDAQYVEASAGFSMGGGKWVSENITNQGELPDMSRMSLNFGIFGKYPIDINSISVFPLIGIDYELTVTAKYTRTEGGEIPIDGRNRRPESAGDLSALWFRAGAGVDISVNESMFIRTSILYGMRTANKFETDNVNIDKTINAEARTGHGVTVKVGMGVKL